MADDQTMLERARAFEGPLGAVAFVVLEGLRGAGADRADLEVVFGLVRGAFEKLDDDQCNQLADVLWQRLLEDRDRLGDAPWYG